MNMFLLSVVAFLVALGLLIAIHEFGHFWVARRAGIKVLRFSIGFGKPIWRRQGRDGTEFVVSMMPLGGYVRMLDGREGDVPASEAHRAFDRQPVSTRMAVVLAGPLANFLFAVVAYWLMFVIGVPGATPLVGEVTEGSPAAAAGLLEGDRIVRVGDRETPTWQAVSIAMLDELLENARIPLTIARENIDQQTLSLDVRGMERRLTERNALFTELGIGFLEPQLDPLLGEPVADSPGARAGLRDGDRVLAVDGVPVSNFNELVEAVQSRPQQRARFTIERNGQTLAVNVEVGSDEVDGRIVGRIGVPVAESAREAYQRFRSEERFGPLAATGQALRQTVEMSGLTLRILWRMLTGDVSIKNISGPVDIAQVAGLTASIGLAQFLKFLAVISISLGILNLLPVPVLDGGQLMFQAIEAVKGSPVSPRVEMLGQQIGIVALLMLMSFAFYNDIARLLG